jgi:hypothetical protein
MMDELQEHLARIGLRVIAGRGFVLGGGHAIELHGMGTRPSEDVGLSALNVAARAWSLTT